MKKELNRAKVELDFTYIRMWEAMELYQKTEDQIRYMIRTGKLEAVKKFGKLLIKNEVV